MVKSKNSMRNWIGFAAYLNQDCFSSPFFSNVISLPGFLGVMKREVNTGLYSIHMYYFGNWLCKMMTMGFYPCMLISIIFWFIDINDRSNENFIEFMKIGFCQSLNALSMGHMWGAIFDDASQALITGFGVMNLIISGMGL